MTEQSTQNDEYIKAPKLVRRMRPKRSEKVRKAIGGDDIRYKGPLSYRHLRIIAWILMAVSICAGILAIVIKNVPGVPDYAGNYYAVMSFLGRMSVPMFLIANFSLILHARDGYKRLLISYAAFSILIYAVFVLVVDHYLAGMAGIFTNDKSLAWKELEALITNIFPNGFLAFNVFIDLFMCTLLTFCLLYNPVKAFQGRKLIIFRLMVFLPILYEIAAYVLKYLCVIGAITLSVHLWPLLPTKPPIVFIVFMILAFYNKNKERVFRASGFTRQEYQEYLGTNRNSFNFSLFAFWLFIIAAIADAIAFIIMLLFMTQSLGTELSKEAFLSASEMTNSIGIGGGTYFLIIAPIMLLFSYTKTYKNKTPDIIIPFGGIIFIVLATIEFVFQMAMMAKQMF